MKKFIALLLSFMLIAMTSVVAMPEDDIVDTAIAAGFDTLVAAVQAAALEETLRGEGPFTVFAPTEQAFADLLAALDVTAEELLAHPRLKEVLLYHVVVGQVEATDVLDAIAASETDSFSTETALGLGEELTFTVGDDGVVINGDVNVTATDVFATNGVIHIIDKVLVPEAFSIEFDTVVDIALSSDDFSILVAALQTAGLVEALQGEGPFTVFAPTNAAFEALLAALDITAEELLGQSELAKVLLFHVLSGKVFSGDITDGLTAPTLNDGLTLTFSLAAQPVGGLAGLGVFINEDTEVTAADIEALNGVVHVIDSVLIPSNFTLDDPIPETNDDNSIIWMGLLLVLGSGLVIISRSLNKKVTA
jgi:transforming growth factor-beta-induced protein